MTFEASLEHKDFRSNACTQGLSKHCLHTRTFEASLTHKDFRSIAYIQGPSKHRFNTRSFEASLTHKDEATHRTVFQLWAGIVTYECHREMYFWPRVDRICTETKMHATIIARQSESVASEVQESGLVHGFQSSNILRSHSHEREVAYQ